ncbi:hypothetical protein RND71_035156 [Anisodus tanguticus]|uniref:Uncharacterized protein n=1 Tax=Anisodus tanguticus TaxID=243964 RepID=A0AAE1V1Y1_9SOLA|nr:hypothetical protein RND71_035156 [Anisodus tanguticus]
MLVLLRKPNTLINKLLKKQRISSNGISEKKKSFNDIDINLLERKTPLAWTKVLSEEQYEFLPWH